MTTAILIAAVAFLAFKLGQAKEIMHSLGGQEFERGPRREPETLDAAHTSGAASTGPSRSIYDGQAEAALDEYPMLSVAPERPGLRVVDS